VEIIVPAMAYKVMAPIFSKKCFLSKEYPASKMIGGNRKKKNTSGDYVGDSMRFG
jgi:hypothetical protein